MEKSAGTCETKVAKSSCGIFHVPTVNDSHGKQLEKDMSSERKPARGKHENSMNKTRSATRSANSSQQNAVVNISKYDPKPQGASTVNSGNSRSDVFKGKTFGFSNSFSHDKVCCFVNIQSTSCIGIISLSVAPPVSSQDYSCFNLDLMTGMLRSIVN
jgi:topoisomerase (DNA) II binding protein 1